MFPTKFWPSSPSILKYSLVPMDGLLIIQADSKTQSISIN